MKVQRKLSRNANFVQIFYVLLARLLFPFAIHIAFRSRLPPSQPIITDKTFFPIQAHIFHCSSHKLVCFVAIQKVGVHFCASSAFANNYLVWHCNDRSVIAPKSTNWCSFSRGKLGWRVRLCKFSTNLHWLQVLCSCSFGTGLNKLFWNSCDLCLLIS